jgi:hypothetical protein
MNRKRQPNRRAVEAAGSSGDANGKRDQARGSSPGRPGAVGESELQEAPPPSPVNEASDRPTEYRVLEDARLLRELLTVAVRALGPVRPDGIGFVEWERMQEVAREVSGTPSARDMPTLIERLLAQLRHPE